MAFEINWRKIAIFSLTIAAIALALIFEQESLGIQQPLLALNLGLQAYEFSSFGSTGLEKICRSTFHAAGCYVQTLA